MNKITGFTLIELMVTLAVGAILLSVAVPSFSTMIMNNRLITQTNDFVTALNIARSEAIKRSGRVTMCKSNDNTACDISATGWEQGWIIFVDSDNDAAADAGEELVRAHGPLGGASGNTIQGTAALVDYISYVGTGFSRNILNATQSGSFALCDNRGLIQQARAVVISGTGRISSLSATDGGSGVTAAICP